MLLVKYQHVWNTQVTINVIHYPGNNISMPEESITEYRSIQPFTHSNEIALTSPLPFSSVFTKLKDHLVVKERSNVVYITPCADCDKR